MKICIYINIPISDTPHFGGPIVVGERLSNLLSSNYNVNILSLSKHIRYKEIKQINENLKIIYIPTQFYKYNSYLLNWYLNVQILKKELIQLKPNIFHSQYPAECISGIKSKTPTILTLHGIIWKEILYSSNPYSTACLLLDNYLFKRYLNRLDGFICINQYVIDELKRINLLSSLKDYTLINNPIDIKYFSNVSKDIDQYIIYIGIISKRKDPLTLIKAFIKILNTFPRFHLYLIGKIVDFQYYQLLYDLCEKKNAIKNIHFMGNVSNDETYKLLSKSSIFILPSLQETAPLSIQESMALGKAIISTNICGMKYMIKNGKTGILFKPKNIEELYDNILYLIENPTIRKQLANNARDYALNNFHPSIIKNQISKYYKKILSK